MMNSNNYKNLRNFAILLILFLLIILTGSNSAKADIAENINEAEQLIDKLKKDPSAISTEKKIEMIHGINLSLAKIGNHIYSSFSPLGEMNNKLIELIDVIDLPSSKKNETLNKLQAIDKWLSSTKELSEILASNSNIFLQDQENQSKNIIAKFSGSGIKNTRPFKVSGPWEIQWNAQGDIFQLYLHSSSGKMMDITASQIGPGEGSSYQAQPGKYYLKVNAVGDWSISIVHVE